MSYYFTVRTTMMVHMEPGMAAWVTASQQLGPWWQKADTCETLPLLSFDAFVFDNASLSSLLEEFRFPSKCSSPPPL